MLRVCAIFLVTFAYAASQAVDYSGHKVFKVIPKTEEHIQFLHRLRSDYGVDLWNEPKALGQPVLFHLAPRLINSVQEALKKKNVEHDIVYHDLQRTIMAEKAEHAPTNISRAVPFDFGKYNPLDQVVAMLKDLSTEHPTVAKLTTIGNSYENRPIYNMKISNDLSGTKPAIMMECGIHAREWSSVAACVYLVNRLITNADAEPEKSLLNKYEFNVVVESNPDGYFYTWTQDRLWRKTRSHSQLDWLGVCRGADANRNFDIEHCGVGTSRKPCDDIYCGDAPFSENESRALKNLMESLGTRLKGYFSVHAFSQLWMTPYGTTKSLPPNYQELQRVGQAGVNALARKYGTMYRLGSIANIIYEAAGSSVDYAYVKHNVKIAFALELRDQGRYGFFLPQQLVQPMAEETYDGLIAAVQAIQ